MDDKIKEVIEELMVSRKVFHSEDDFKFSLAWLLKKKISKIKVRLEKPENIEMVQRDGTIVEKRAPIDIVIVQDDGTMIPIELKYKTKEATINIDEEQYNLKDQRADDIGRFSFRKDIFRIEKFLQKDNYCFGYFIIITNDEKYRKNISNSNYLHQNYSFHDGAKIKKDDPGWNYSAIDKERFEYNKEKNKWINRNNQNPHWTCKGDLYSKLDLNRDYNIKWKDYSEINNTKFKYCLLRIS